MHGPVMYAIATEQITTSAGNIHSPSLNFNKPHARAHANERDLSIHQQMGNCFHMPCQRQPQRITFDAPSQAIDYGNNVNGNIVGANRDTRHHRYRVTKSQLSAIPSVRKSDIIFTQSTTSYAMTIGIHPRSI
ncbi:hypothetical protein Tco_0661882 [Tanacetum coccineum]